MKIPASFNQSVLNIILSIPLPQLDSTGRILQSSAVRSTLRRTGSIHVFFCSEVNVHVVSESHALCCEMNALILSCCACSALIEASEQLPLHPERIKALVIHLLLTPERRSESINHSNVKQMPLVISTALKQNIIFAWYALKLISALEYLSKTDPHIHTNVSAQMAGSFKED